MLQVPKFSVVKCVDLLSPFYYKITLPDPPEPPEPPEPVIFRCVPNNDASWSVNLDVLPFFLKYIKKKKIFVKIAIT